MGDDRRRPRPIRRIRFKTFTADTTPGLASDRFNYRALWEDRQGNLWMGTDDAGVVRMRDGRFTSYGTREGLPGNNVFRIDEDEAGTIWIFTTQGLAIWRDGQIRAAPDPDGSLAAHLVAPATLGVDARFCGLWRGNTSGWERFAFGRWRAFPAPPGLRMPAALAIRSIVEDARQRVWYNVKDRPGEYYGVEPDGRLRIFHGVPSEYHVLYEDRRGRLWQVGTVVSCGRAWLATPRSPRPSNRRPRF